MDLTARCPSHIVETMKILYGVVGEGTGHAIRSRVVLSHLIGEGHEVEVMASAKAAEYLSARFDKVRRIHGLHLITDRNQVRLGRTVLSNLLRGAAALPRQIASYFKLISQFAPQLVISDFESWTYTFAKTHNLPIISIDNMQVIHRCRHDAEILRGQRAAYEVTRSLVQSKLPRCKHYLITTFFQPKIVKKRTTLHPPILRPEILAAPTTRADHLLVYQTVGGGEGLVEALSEAKVECRVYGMRPGLEQERVEGNLRYRPFDEETFIADLASARAVVASAGFTLMGECVYLRKPMLATPIAGHFEQIMNGRYLQKLGYGRMVRAVTPIKLREFVASLPIYEERLAGYVHDGNRSFFEELDLHVDRAVVGVY
jgi:uncharacterized protein (TIGR00661 family)